MYGSDPALPLWTAGIELAVFIYGFGSGGKCNGDFHMVALLTALAGAVIFVAGLAALDPVVPSD